MFNVTSSGIYKLEHPIDMSSTDTDIVQVDNEYYKAIFMSVVSVQETHPRLKGLKPGESVDLADQWIANYKSGNTIVVNEVSELEDIKRAYGIDLEKCRVDAREVCNDKINKKTQMDTMNIVYNESFNVYVDLNHESVPSIFKENPSVFAALSYSPIRTKTKNERPQKLKYYISEEYEVDPKELCASSKNFNENDFIYMCYTNKPGESSGETMFPATCEEGECISPDSQFCVYPRRALCMVFDHLERVRTMKNIERLTEWKQIGASEIKKRIKSGGKKITIPVLESYMINSIGEHKRAIEALGTQDECVTSMRVRQQLISLEERMNNDKLRFEFTESDLIQIGLNLEISFGEHDYLTLITAENDNYHFTVVTPPLDIDDMWKDLVPMPTIAMSDDNITNEKKKAFVRDLRGHLQIMCASVDAKEEMLKETEDENGQIVYNFVYRMILSIIEYAKEKMGGFKIPGILVSAGKGVWKVAKYTFSIIQKVGKPIMKNPYLTTLAFTIARVVKLLICLWSNGVTDVRLALGLAKAMLKLFVSKSNFLIERAEQFITLLSDSYKSVTDGAKSLTKVLLEFFSGFFLKNLGNAISTMTGTITGWLGNTFSPFSASIGAQSMNKIFEIIEMPSSYIKFRMALMFLSHCPTFFFFHYVHDATNVMTSFKLSEVIVDIVNEFDRQVKGGEAQVGNMQKAFFAAVIFVINNTKYKTYIQNSTDFFMIFKVLIQFVAFWYEMIICAIKKFIFQKVPKFVMQKLPEFHIDESEKNSCCEEFDAIKTIAYNTQEVWKRNEGDKTYNKYANLKDGYFNTDIVESNVWEQIKEYYDKDKKNVLSDMKTWVVSTSKNNHDDFIQYDSWSDVPLDVAAHKIVNKVKDSASAVKKTVDDNVSQTAQLGVLSGIGTGAALYATGALGMLGGVAASPVLLPVAGVTAGVTAVAATANSYFSWK